MNDLAQNLWITGSWSICWYEKYCLAKWAPKKTKNQMIWGGSSRRAGRPVVHLLKFLPDLGRMGSVYLLASSTGSPRLFWFWFFNAICILDYLGFPCLFGQIIFLYQYMLQLPVKNKSFWKARWPYKFHILL